MSFILGAQTLLYPKSFRREFIEKSVSNILIDAKTTRRVENRKERYILTYQNLTTAQASSILSEYNTDETRTFQVTETHLPISATKVHIDISVRNYPLTAKEYRQDLTLMLTEVI